MGKLIGEQTVRFVGGLTGGFRNKFFRTVRFGLGDPDGAGAFGALNFFCSELRWHTDFFYRILGT